MTAIQILIDGFAISALYALGATGFTLIFGVSGVLNLSHGALMVTAAVVAWAASSEFGLGSYAGAAAGVAVCTLLTLATSGAVVRPIDRSRAIPPEEKEIFILTGTLLWGIMIQEFIAYLFTSNAKTVMPIVEVPAPMALAPSIIRAPTDTACVRTASSNSVRATALP